MSSLSLAASCKHKTSRYVTRTHVHRVCMECCLGMQEAAGETRWEDDLFFKSVKKKKKINKDTKSYQTQEEERKKKETGQGDLRAQAEKK